MRAEFFNSYRIRKTLVFILISTILSSLIYREEIKSWLEPTPKTIRLENLLRSKIQPDDGQNIFFLDTTRMKKHKKAKGFTARQACAIESAGDPFIFEATTVINHKVSALINPNLKIFVCFVSRYGHDHLNSSLFISTILKYPNVHLNKIDVEEFSIGSPLEAFIKSGQLYESKFVVSHTSDVLRLLVLWKYGGTYLDSDMIVRKRLDLVGSNFVCNDVANVVNGAIINLDSGQAGKSFAEIFMKNLETTFNGTVWGTNGPELITRVLKSICNTDDTLKMVEMNDCDGFHVLPRRNCYPVRGLSWADFFNESMAESVMNDVKDSIVVHFWNNLSKRTKLRVNSTAVYTRLARQFCPKVMASCGKYF